MQPLTFDDPERKTLSPQMCEALALRIRTDIDEWCVKEYTDDHRTHLGASVIGHDCNRYIFYAFRWVRFEIFNGRMLRLFNTGKLEELRAVEYLRGIGFSVFEIDPATNKQYRIWGAKGHYGGSTDAVSQVPYPELSGLTLLCEFKTHNRGSYAKLIKEKLIVSKPRHYAQMCSYGRYFKLRYGLYYAKNKDDDDIHIEIVPLDWSLGDDLSSKAEGIIFANSLPEKISLSPAYFDCKYCPFKGPCHYKEIADKNCRSCQYSVPIDNAKWFCKQFQLEIPEDFIPKGCERHTSI